MLSAFSPPCLYFSFVHCLSAVWLAPSFIRLYVRTLPKFQNLPKLKSTNNPLFIFILALTYPHFSFVISLSARAARTVICSSFVRHLFVFCSSFVRLLFVFCSSFVRLLFVFCSSFVRSLFVLCSFIHCSSFLRLLFVSLFGYYTPSPWERVGERIFSSSFHYLPVRLAPSFVRSLFVHCSSFL
ncbi:hypothetical protein HMPREF1321_2161 [Capnocytophaga sp. oral taxon 412 str. F0487]|nr:hypothetical protein HMPREF1321_2161 [Capnocytophaga sp. oral taxon 412 str. F0487]